MRKWLRRFGGTLLFALALNAAAYRLHRAALQQGIAEAVLRFHILANSDSEEDQAVKYEVRDALLQWMEETMEEEDAAPGDSREAREMLPEETGEGDLVGSEGSSGAAGYRKDGADAENTEAGRARTLSWLEGHLSEIEEKANETLAAAGASYRATAELCSSYFPERTYGDCTFPAGWYQALRLRLGRAEGQNWWCVLYPRLCFSDCLHAFFEDGAEADLKEALTEEEYESLLQKPQEWSFVFAWFW